MAQSLPAPPRSRGWSQASPELSLIVSSDTLPNRIRGAFRAESGGRESVRVVGVDDFGFKRDNASSTIMGTSYLAPIDTHLDAVTS
jgi:hypothetical protein